MQKMLMSLMVGSCVVLSVQAAEDAELASVCNQLESALERQVVALTSVKDSASAAEALPEIRQALDAQKALFGVDEHALWNYIDHTDSVKTALMRVLQRLAAQLDRLDKVNFYDNAELKVLLF